MKTKKIMVFFLIVAISVCNNYSVLAVVSEYTNGPRCKKIDIENYVESADDLIVNNPYDVNSFADFSAKHSLINIQTSNSGKAIGNIYGGAWVKYDNFDFGSEERKLNSLNIEVAHPEGYVGVVRVYLLNCRGEREITTSLGVYQGMVEGDIKIAEHRFEKTDICGDGWTVPEELIIAPDVEMVKGTYDILITFSSTGIGNYFNFWFSAEAIDEDDTISEFIACNSNIKFSDADLYSWASGYKPGSDFVHTTSRNKWLLYRNIDFGRDGIDSELPQFVQTAQKRVPMA